MNWVWIGGAAALGTVAWWLWPEEHPKSAIEHLVPKADEKLIPMTPQHYPAALAHLKEGQAMSPARTLYQTLRGGAAPPVLVAAFQRSADRDPLARQLIGPIPQTGIYDPRTSAALTMFTEDPVPAHESVADMPHPTTPAAILSTAIPGNAAVAGSNLYVYLLTHGKDHSATLQALTKRFQQAVNTDPKFPGPANKNGLPILIPSRLVEDGVAGSKTLRALAVLVPQPTHLP
jgi:hypothetical protein